MVLNHRFWLKDNVQKLEIVGGGVGLMMGLQKGYDFFAPIKEIVGALHLVQYQGKNQNKQTNRLGNEVGPRAWNEFQKSFMDLIVEEDPGRQLQQ